MKKISVFGNTWALEGFLPGEKKIFLAGFAIKTKIYTGKSKYQSIDIFDTKGYGRMFFLDGLVQLSTKDEAVYHEMLVHPALMHHPSPQRVLIIGGGDGGALREVLKHPVKEAFLVEIDEEVIYVAKKYLPTLCRSAFGDKRSKIVVADGIEFVAKHKNYFDCIILDSNDPDGVMAAKLFEEKFLRAVKNALRKDGIFSAQTGYISDTFGLKARATMRKVFYSFELHRAFVGSFPRDEHSFPVASLKMDLAKTTEKVLEKRYKERRISTSYYSPVMHFASGVFPPLLK
ncbi:polyamine aminopropyltransferase [Patescibacteria group bacterium]|nr:polyamine aminopropyltransferase [Patescibacteria group bacterium]